MKQKSKSVRTIVRTNKAEAMTSKSPNVKTLHGLNLKLFVESGHATAVQIGKVLGISRQTVYVLYGEQVLNQDYVRKLSKAGLFVPGINEAGGYSLEDTVELRKELDLYRELAISREQTIKYQQQLLEKR